MICTQTKKPVHSRQKGSLIGNQTFQQNIQQGTTTTNAPEEMDESTKKVVDFLNQEKESQEKEEKIQNFDKDDDDNLGDLEVSKVSDGEEPGQQKVGWEILVSKPPNEQTADTNGEQETGYNNNIQEQKQSQKHNILEFYDLPKKFEYSQVDIKKYLEISQKYIDFGRFFPGQEFEREIELINISSENIVVNVTLTNQFDGSYKLKKSDISAADLDDEGNKLQLLIAAQSSTCFVIQLYGKTNIPEQIMDIVLMFQLEGFPINTQKHKDLKPIIEKTRDDNCTQKENYENTENTENTEKIEKIEKTEEKDQKPIENQEEKQSDQIIQDKQEQQENKNPDEEEEEEEQDNNNNNNEQLEKEQEQGDNNNKEDQDDEEEEEDENDQERQKEIVIPVLAQLLIPQIACPKAMLFNDMKVIKLACKLANPQTEMRVVFQVQKYSSIVDIEFIDDEPNDFVSIRAKIPLVIVDYNGFLMLNVQMRPNFINIKDNQIKKVQKVLLLKLRNTSLIFSFPIVIEIC